jgi:GNAT superfamily N-acetyltransferase
MSAAPPAPVTLRLAAPSDFPEVRRITQDAYLQAGHFTADHPYMSVLEDVEHRAEHAQVWVAEAAGKVVAAVTLTFAGQPYSEIARDGELEFRMLAVDPAHQGGGVGRAVVRGVRATPARHRGDQHHQRHLHGACPPPL